MKIKVPLSKMKELVSYHTASGQAGEHLEGIN